MSVYSSPSADPRAVGIWENFLREGRVADHFARAAARYAGQPAWSLIVPVTDDRVRARATAIQSEVDGTHGAEGVSLERLHITIETLAIEPPDRWQEKLGRSLAAFEPIEVAIGGTNAFPESAMLEVLNPEPLRELRATLLDEHPWLAGGVPQEVYLPHVSIVYFGANEPAADVVDVLGRSRTLPPLTSTVSELLASRLAFDERGRSRRLESHSIALRGAA